MPVIVQTPIYSMDKMLNGESIDNQDLVCWVSMGVMHITRSEVCLSACMPYALLFSKHQKKPIALQLYHAIQLLSQERPTCNPSDRSLRYSMFLPCIMHRMKKSMNTRDIGFRKP